MGGDEESFLSEKLLYALRTVVGRCINFLLLLYQINPNIVTLPGTKLLFYSSIGQKSNGSLTGGVGRDVFLSGGSGENPFLWLF